MSNISMDRSSEISKKSLVAWNRIYKDQKES